MDIADMEHLSCATVKLPTVFVSRSEICLREAPHINRDVRFVRSSRFWRSAASDVGADLGGLGSDPGPADAHPVAEAGGQFRQLQHI